MVYAKVNFVKTFELTATQSLLWYLREEPMEVQIIISTSLPSANGGNSNNNNNNAKDVGSSNNNDATGADAATQRIVGAIQLRLDGLVTQAPDIHGSTEVGGEYPVFNREADALDGACVSLNAKLEREDTPTRDLGRGTPSTLSRRGSVNDVAEIGVEMRSAPTVASTGDGMSRCERMSGILAPFSFVSFSPSYPFLFLLFSLFI